MIFEISPEFDNFTSPESWAPYTVAIDNLINAHVRGEQYLLPTRAIAENLLSLDCFSGRQKAALEFGILSKIATLSSGAGVAKVTIYLTPDNPNIGTMRVNQRAVPLKRFDDSVLTRHLCVLVENSIRDGRFLDKLVLTLAPDSKFSEIPRLHFEMGGGSSLADCYAEKIRQQTPTFCVVDSDRQYPAGPLGETARRVQNLIGTEPLPTMRAYILEVREIENLIPIDIVKAVYERDPQMQIKADIYLRIEYLS